ncbi:unnamed protein product, partial [Didymodactylos carnosus]
IAYYKDVTIVILDTEGLLSLEDSSLEGLVGMSIYAKLLQSSPLKLYLLFVLRDQMDRNKKIFCEQLTQFKDNLQTSSRFLKVSIDDELEIKHENIVLLPSAFSEDVNSDLNIEQRWRNQTFSIKINELRLNIFHSLNKQIIKQNHGHKDFDCLYNN